MKQIFLVLTAAFLFPWELSSQCTTGVPWCTGLNAIGGTDFLGGNGSNTNPLRIQTSGTTAITILGTNQNVGIGMANPAFRVDVDGGDINVHTAANGYRIGNDYVIWHNDDLSNIYVGVGAGLNDGGANNTFVGNDAGNSNTNGTDNTFIGRDAGLDNNGDNNTFIGSAAGAANTTGAANVFIGTSAAATHETGDHNVIIGADAAWNSDGGDGNVIIGGNGTGSGNMAGSNNTFIGFATLPGVANLTNATAIGANAQVDCSDCMVLGNDVFVGIGTTVPTASLHLDGTFLYRVNGANPTSGHILTTDGNGNATWQAPPTGTINACNATQQNQLAKWCNNGSITFDNSLVFDNGTNVGISTTTPGAHLDVVNSGALIGIRGATTLTSGLLNFGVLGSCATTGSSWFNIGVGGTAPSSSGTVFNIGVNGGQNTTGNFFNIGVRGQACGSNLVNYGGFFDAGCNQCLAPGTIFPINIGVFATATGVETHSGVCNATALAGFYNGSVVRTGTDNFASDIKLKDSIATISGSLDVIARLRPKHFVFKSDSFPFMNLPTGKHYGFIAQEMDTVLPELVTEVLHPGLRDTSGILMDTLRFNAVHYTGLIPLTIAAIQEQQAEIEGKVSVCGLPGSTPAHYLPKWDSVNRVLCHSIVHDNGTAVGIPAAQAGSYFTVSNSSDTVAAMFTSTDTGTVAVVKAVYNINSSHTNTAAVYGYSNYSNGGDADGIGGKFTGGKHGVYGLAAGNTNQLAGILGEAQGAAFMNIGVMGKSADTADVYNVGVLGNTEGSEQVNVGTGGISEFANGTSVNLGVVGIAGGSQYENFGGNFEATDTVGLNYGVYAAVHDSDDYAGYFNGDVHIVGALTRGSDAKLKNNLQNIAADSSLAWLRKLEPKTYTYRREDYPSLTLPAGVQYGFTAQEVEKVLPHLVKDIIRPETRDLKGNITGQWVAYKGVDYLGFVPLLVGALKAQQTQIDSLKGVITDRLASIEQRLNGCCPTGASFKADEGETTENKINIELSNLQVIVLEQNVPNPFAEQTSISYYIPENINHAQIVFTDVLGTVIKTAYIKSGYGTVTVFAQNLSSGQYSYSLVIEGKVMESKKMVKQR
ncbi:MAG: tail fiber domain-containing protein [Chitinophagales bacterium]|nr:tail fiber domain-containing protein [Chitinophagales bacterium]